MLQTTTLENQLQDDNLNVSIENIDSNQIQVSQVVNEIEKCIDSLEEGFKETPWNNRLCYAEFLAQSYYQTSYTPRLEALAISRCNADSDFFPLFLESFQGEIGHESLALQDLKSLGYSIRSFPELPATASVYHSIFYFMNYESPLAVLGYKIPLEGFANRESQKLFYQKMVDLYGESSTSFLKVHDAEDTCHYRQGLEMLQMCTSRDLTIISKVCQQASYTFRAMMASITKTYINQ